MITKPRHITFADFARELDAVFDEIAEHRLPAFVERRGQLSRPAGPSAPPSRVTYPR